MLFTMMYAAGQALTRSEGPDMFHVPCVVRVLLDCEEGTLRMVVKDKDSEWDLGVVCGTLPKGARLQLAVGTWDRECRATVLGYSHTGADGLCL